MDLEYSVITQAKDIDVLQGRTSQYRNLHVRYDEATLDYLKAHLADAGSLYLLVKEGDAFAGFCSVDSDWWEQDYLFLREIFVEPAYQQRGIGLELMQRSIAHARQAGVAGIVTETAFENIPMQKLCTKCGFTVWENKDWQEGITYKLSLPGAGCLPAEMV